MTIEIRGLSPKRNESDSEPESGLDDERGRDMRTATTGGY
jgi:hypothetical protein